MAVTTYGKATTIPTLLTAIKDQIVAECGLDDSLVFESFEDEKLDRYPSSSEFIQIAPQRGQVDQALAAGSGYVQVDLQLAVNYWKQLSLDVAYEDAELLKNETHGILVTFREILRSLNQFSPVDDPAETQSILTEPARPLGFEFRPRKQSNGWSCIRSWHLFPILMDLS